MFGVYKNIGYRCHREGIRVLRCLSYGLPVRISDKTPPGGADASTTEAQGFTKIIDYPDQGPPIPDWQKREGEELKVLRARLLYQSRKRGMSENCLVLSHFAAKYLDTFDRAQLEEYDFLVNKPSNDWDLYYWIMQKKETPEEFNVPMMDLLKEYVKNEEMEIRSKQPNLKETSDD